jgi:hypothetical protein
MSVSDPHKRLIVSISLVLMLISCASVQQRGSQTVTGNVISILDREAQVPELMGAVTRVFEVAPVSNPQATIILIKGAGCPMDNIDKAQRFVMRYSADSRYYVELARQDPPRWQNNLVIVECSVTNAELP